MPLSPGLLGSVEGHREKRSGPDLISQKRVERRAKKTGLCLRLPHSCWLGPMKKVILAEKKKAHFEGVRCVSNYKPDRLAGPH